MGASRGSRCSSRCASSRPSASTSVRTTRSASDRRTPSTSRRGQRSAAGTTPVRTARRRSPRSASSSRTCAQHGARASQPATSPAWRPSIRGLRAVYDARGWYRAISDLATRRPRASSIRSRRRPTDQFFAVAMRSEQARALTALEGYTPEVEAAYERLLGTVSSGGRAGGRIPILRGLASLYSFRNENEEATGSARRILRLGEEQADPAVQVDGHLLIGMGLSFEQSSRGRHPGLRGRHRPRRASPVRRSPVPAGTRPARRDTHRALAAPLVAGTSRHVPRAVAAARSRSPRRSGTRRRSATDASTPRSCVSGEASPRRPVSSQSRVIDIADEHDLRIWKAVGTVVLGASAVELGLGDEGLRWVDEGLERYRGLRTPPIFWPFLLRSGRRMRGKPDEWLKAGIDRRGARARTRCPTCSSRRATCSTPRAAMPKPRAATTRPSRGARGWGAAMLELRAAVRACALDLPEGPTLEVRRARGCARCSLGSPRASTCPS